MRRKETAMADGDKDESAFKLGDRAAAKKTVEDWANQKGLLPEMQAPGRARLGQFTVPSPRPNPKYVLFAQAKALRGWPEGAEVTEQEFDSAIKEAQGIEAR